MVILQQLLYKIRCGNFDKNYRKEIVIIDAHHEL